MTLSYQTQLNPRARHLHSSRRLYQGLTQVCRTIRAEFSPQTYHTRYRPVLRLEFLRDFLAAFPWKLVELPPAVEHFVTESAGQLLPGNGNHLIELIDLAGVDWASLPFQIAPEGPGLAAYMAEPVRVCSRIIRHLVRLREDRELEELISLKVGRCSRGCSTVVVGWQPDPEWRFSEEGMDVLVSCFVRRLELWKIRGLRCVFVVGSWRAERLMRDWGSEADGVSFIRS